jgi:PhzF family phenazine biosynthesis protein
MQSLAGEMNLAETAFVSGYVDGHYGLRWFTPLAEVDLCGHATLASAHVLWTTQRHSVAEPIVFMTRSGRLTVSREGSEIKMDFPAQPSAPAEPPAGMIEALGIEPLCVERNATDYLVQVDSESTLQEIQPDFRGLAAVEARGIIVTCESAESEYDFKSRFFAPAVGVDEDPVTGSAHCCLARFWQPRLGKSQLTGFQASRRGGVVRVENVDDRVHLYGHAVTVFAAELLA